MTMIENLKSFVRSFRYLKKNDTDGSCLSKNSISKATIYALHNVISRKSTRIVILPEDMMTLSIIPGGIYHILIHRYSVNRNPIYYT
jgi:hypothetical protein